MAQPIIRGIQAVGAVDIKYQYNGSEHKLILPTGSIRINNETGEDQKVIDTTGFISVAGFRLDGEFLRAVQQIASSVQIPILGGGAIALTNNNRSGTLSINATRVSTPAPAKVNEEGVSADGKVIYKPGELKSTGVGSMIQGGGVCPITSEPTYDLTFLAQVQQAQPGGDSVGATIQVCFAFCGLYTVIQFEGCTIANVDPVGLSGNDAVNYNVAINYLNWTVNYSSGTETAVTQ